MDFMAAATAASSRSRFHKVQVAVHESPDWQRPGCIAGWTVALTLPTPVEPLKLSGPVSQRIYQSGCAPERAGSRRAGVRAGIECEMVARMSKTVKAKEKRTPPTRSKHTSPTSLRRGGGG